MQPYNPEWQDMSNYVVHFTKATAVGNAYDNMLSILGSRVLNASLFGIGRRCAPNKDTQASVCFSEAPLHLIERIAQERGRYGIGFTKRFILERDGGPIWYVERGGSTHQAIWALIRQALHAPQPVDDPIWELTPFIDSHGGTYQLSGKENGDIVETFISQSMTLLFSSFLKICMELQETSFRTP